MTKTRKITTVLIAGLTLLAAACNTIEGVGEDTESVGGAISDAAK